MLETLLQHDRMVIALALVLLTALAWWSILQGAGTGMSASAMTTWQFPPPHVVPSPGAWNAAYWLTMLTMWWIMMIAMMIPSAAPMILLHARVVRHARDHATPGNALWLGGGIRGRLPSPAGSDSACSRSQFNAPWRRSVFSTA